MITKTVQDNEKTELSYKLFKCLKNSIASVYKNEKGYFASVEGRERSMVFRIAHMLAMELVKKINSKGIFVDIEATRCEKCPKRDENGALIIPDLIVHLRDGNGYLAVEFKCGNAPEANDYRKLRMITKNKELRNEKRKDYPFYVLGAFIRLEDEGIEYTLFEGGKETKTCKGTLLDSKTFKWNPEKTIKRREK